MEGGCNLKKSMSGEKSYSTRFLLQATASENHLRDELNVANVHRARRGICAVAAMCHRLAETIMPKP